MSLSSSTAQSPTFTAPTELLSNASLVFSLKVSDGVNTSTADTVTITVTAGANDAPTADAGSDATVAEGATVTLDGSGSSDPERAALTYAWSQTSGTTVSLSSSTAQSPTFTAPTELLSNASLVFSLTVSDGVNTSTADTVTITVTAGVNDAPTADAGSDATVAEGATVTLDGSGSDDPENAALTYAWSQTSGTTVSLSSSTAQSPTFTAPTELLANASLVFSLKVSDGVNTSTADTVTITVTAGANDAPTADAGSDATVAEGANVTLDGSGSDDPENAALTYAWSQTSGTTVSLSSSTAQSPTFTAPTELLSNASLVFSLKVSDGVNTSTADTVTITVTAGVNDAPTADAGSDATVAEGATVTLDGSGSTDPERAALTYAWSQTSGTTVSLSSSTAQSPTFTAPTELLSNASLVFSLKVSDGVNTSTADTVTITVTAGANDAPTADAGSDATVAEGATVTLDGSGSDDPENAALTYAWSQTSGTTVSLSSSTAQSPTFTAPTELLSNASLVFSLTVSDGVNTSTADTVTITVTAGVNDAPTADAGSDATVAEGATVTLDGSGSDDPENAALTYAWSQTSGTTVSLSSSTAQSPTFTAPTELLSNASLVFSLKVSDGVNTSTADTVTITVTAGANDAPTADAGSDATVAEGATVTLDGSGSDDPENAALTYAWSQTSGTTVSLSSSTAQSPTFTAPTELLSNASLVFSLTVSDGVNTSTADTVTITVTAGVNDAPTADAGSDATVAEGATVTLDGSGSDDPENAALTYAWSQTSGTTVSLSSSTAQSPTFTAPTELLSNASLVFSLKVSDGVNTSTADTVTITVTAGVNDAPTADAGSDATVAEGATVTLDGSGSSDPENAALTYAWSQTSGTTVSLSSSTAQSPTFTAPTELLSNASLVFSLTVSDGVNTSTADTVTITVTAGVNDAPTADAGSDATVAEGANVTLDGSGSSDPERAALTYAWSQTSGTTVSLSSSTAQSPTFTAPTELLSNASLVFSLKVSDGVNTSTADTVTITVTAGANDAPTADAGSDATVAEGATVTLDGSGSSDPERAALTYAWSQTSGTTVSLSSSTAQSPTFTAPTELLSNASLVFSLKVSDGVNTSTADTVTITVTAGANDAPTADAGSDATVAEGATVTLDGSGSDDPENAALTYAWSQTSGTTVSLSSSTAQSPTFTAPTELLSNASLVFSLKVSDGVNTSTADTVTITVTAGANDAPTADAGSDATVAEGATVTLDGSGSDDPENAALTYAWSQTSGTTVSLSSSTAQSPTFTAPTELLANASLVFSLKVSDGVNTSTADTVTITVTAGANDAPTADAGSDATVAEGATVTLDGSGSDDPENAALTYAWSQTSGSTVSLSSSTAQSPTFTAPTELLANASLVFSLKVSDGVNTSTADTVTITVTAGANDAPTADAGSDATVAEGANVTLDGSGSDDPENAALTYAWSQTSGTTVSLSSSTAQSPTFTAPTELLSNASLVFSLKVSDGVNTSTADTVTITVTAGVNDAPTADAGSDATVAEGATVTLDGSGSTDPERAALTYAWSQTSGTTVSLSSSTAQSPTFTAPTELLSNASLVFSLKVSDGVNTSTADTVTITVTAGANDAPTADAGSDATVAEGATVTLDGSGSDDPENAALTYAWSQTSGTTVSLSSSTAQSPTFTAPTELLSNASLVFSLTVSDGVNTSTADTVTITVTAGVNDAPTADAGSDATVAEGATVTLDGSGSDDPENAALTYAWSQTSGTTVSLSSSTAQSPTFTAPTELLANASLVFSLKVSDGVNTSTADTVTITVTAGANDAPTADAGSDATVAEGATVTLDGSGSDDPENAALTYAWSQTSGSTVSLSSSTAQSPTFTAPTELLSNASLVFSLKVSDGVNTSTADTVTITVTAGANDAPTADAGSDATVAEGATVTLDGSGSDDPENAALTYAWSQTSGTTVSLSSSTAQSPTFTAPTELLSNASLVFSLKVSDGVNTSTADTVTITVTAGVNDAPTADAGSDATVTEGATVTLDGSGSDDPENAALTYAWSQTSGTTVSLSSSTAQSPTFTAPTELLSNASLVFSLKVSDGVNTSTADTVTITVTAGANDAPTADAGSDATVAEGATVTLDGSGSDDPENAALTYAWSQTSGTTVSLSSSTAQSPTFTAPTELLSNASLVFSLKVSDGVNTSTADTVTITVTAGVNDAPTADAGSDATVTEGATVTLDGSGSDDPENAALTYSWSQTSGTTVSLSSSTAQSPTFTAPTELLSNASLVFSLKVSDGVNTSTADTVTITVTAGANDAPTADAGSDATVAEGATVTLDGSGSDDPENAALTYAWSQTSGTTVSLSSSTAQSPTFTAPTELLSNASLVFSLKVSDGVNTSTADTVTITVTAGANDAPTADAGSDATVAEGATVTLDGSGSDDPENAALTYAWSQTSGSTVSLSSSTAQSPTFTAPTELLANASLVFSLKVSDGVNTSTADTVTITVTAGANDAPTADAGSDATVAEGATVTLDGSGSDDPENAALTYAWSQTSGTTVSLSSSTAQSPTFTAPTELLTNASLVFSLKVSDGVNTSTADTVTITVTAGANDAPTADAGTNQTVAEAATVTLDGSGSDDPENAALTYAWSQTSGSTVSLSSSTAQSPTFTAPTELLANASLVFSLKVSDGVNTSTADTVTITVTAGANDAPTADAGTNQTVAEGANVTLDGSGSDDPENAALTYAWSQTSGSTVSLSSSTAQSPTFTAPTELLANASLVFSLKVSDGVNTSTADTVTITVTAGANDAPTADAGTNQTVAEAATVTLDGSGSDDPENAALTYSWSQTSGTTVSLSSSTAQSPTFTAPTELLSNASLVFSLKVSDGVNTSTADTVTITVTAGANDAPTADAGTNQTVAEGAGVTLDGSGSDDPENAALTYAWSQTSGTTVSLSSSTAQSPTFTAPTELLANASLVFSLTVSDGVNTSTADTVTITVTAGANDAPTADAGSDATVAEGATVTLDGSGSDDPENAALTYAWSQTSGSTVSLSSSTAQSPTFTAPTELLANASLVFSLKVSDGVNTSTADTVTITVTAGANDAPTADAGTNQTVAEGANVTLDGSGSDDPENAALTYAWSQTSGSTVSLSSSTAQSPTFTAPTELLSNASLVFSLKVSDGVNTSTADTVTITVTAGANDAPTADAGTNQTVAEAATVTLDGSGSDDPENAALTYSWSQTSGTTVSLSSSTAQSPTFTAPTELLSNASLVFSLKVSDGVNTSTADTVTITVTAGANDAPTADAGTNQTVAEGATVTLDGSGSDDPENAALTYAWSQTSGTTVSLSSSTAQSPTFTAPTELLANASLVFSLTVSDGVNTSTADTVTITVTAGANDAPTADAGSDATVAEGASVTLDGSGSDDPENAALTYAWSQTSGTTVSLSSSTAQSPTFTAPTELLTNASLVFSLTVSDGVNTSTADTVTITVTAGANPPAPDTAPLDQTPEFSPDTFADQVFGKNQPVDVTLPQATGGDGELSYGLEPELPEGLGFDATTLAISGVPTEAMAPTPYTLTATDADGDSATLTFSVAVEEPVLISVSDAEPVAEGASGETTLAEFEVSLSRSSSLEVTVGYATRDSTAEAATDYSAASGVLTFSPGETGKTVSVTVNGDDEVEADETFALSLSSPSNGQVDPQNAEAEALILNDDEAVVSAEACGEAFPTGDTTVRISCSSGLPEIDLIVVLPARLTRNGVAIEEVTVTLTPSDQEIDGEMFGYTGDSDHHSLIDIDISPIPDDEVTIGLPVTPHLRGHARGRRLFLIRHSGAWEELESSSEDHRIHADVNGFSPFAVAYEIDTVRRRLGNVNRTILPELSRAVTSSALDAVTRRVEDAISGGAENVFTMPAPYTSEFNEPGPKLGELEDGHSVSLSEAVDGSYFSASLAGDRDRPGGGADPAPRGSDGLGVWVSGDYRSLSGAGSSVYWSGDLFAGHLGADYRFGSRLVAGIAASWFEGSFDYTETGAESSVSGDYDARMNGFYPYLGISLSPKVDVWAAGGWGFGEIKIDDGELSGRRKGGVGLATAAAGANVRLFADGATAVSLRAETWFSRLRMKDNGGRIEGITVKTDRLRAVLQGSHSLFFGSGALLEPSVELGLRRDGGDGETGTGAELGAGIGYMSPALGLAVDIRGRTLLAHEGSTKEWGVGGSVRFDPGEYGRGIFLNAVPSYGESSSAVDRLWDSETAVADAAGYGVSYGRTLSFETEVGYGFPAFGGRGFFTPYGAFGRHGSDGSSYRAGSRFSLGSSFDIGLEGQRQEFQGVEPEHGITLTGSVNW